MRLEFQYEADKRRFLVVSPFAMYDVLKAIPGATPTYGLGKRMRGAFKGWAYPDTPATAVSLHELSLAHNTKIDALAWERIEAALAERQVDDYRRQDLKVDDLPFKASLACDPWHWQKAAYWFSMRCNNPLLWCDPGTGKSLMLLNAIRGRDANLTLISCKKKAQQTWLDQIELHWGKSGDLVTYTICHLTGTVAKKAGQLKAAREAARDANRYVIVLVNHESIWRGALGKVVLATRWDMVCPDEIHKLKAPGSKVSFFFRNLGKRVRFKVGLSGTALPEVPVLDAYGVCRFLDLGLFGSSFTNHRATYCVMGGFEGHQVLTFQNLSRFKDKLRTITMHVPGSVLGLEESIHAERVFDLPPAIKSRYQELKREFVTEFDNHEVTAANALTRLTRFQQITSGFIKDDLGRTVDLYKGKIGGKAALLQSELEDIGPSERVIMFYLYTPDLETIRRVCDLKGIERACGAISGKHDDQDKWKSGEVNTLAVQIAAGGESIDGLQTARFGIYYSNTFSNSLFRQSLRRLERGGQTRQVTFIHLLARGTIDRARLTSVNSKQRVVLSLLDDLDAW